MAADAADIDSLGDLRGQARAGPLRPQRPARRHHDHRRRPDPGQRPDHPGAGRRRRPGRRDRPPRPPQGRAGPGVLPRARSPARLGELLGQAGRLRHRHRRRERAGQTVGGARRRRGRRAGERPVQRGRDQQGRRRARRVRRPAGRAGRRLRLRRLRRRAPQAGLGLRRRAAAARTRWAGWSPRRSTCCAGSPTTRRGPYVVVLGGSKVSDKLGVIDNLLGKADRLLIGGGMVFTFLTAQGHEVGKSLLEDDQLDTCRGYLQRAAEQPASRSCCRPTSWSTPRSRRATATPQPRVVPADAIPADALGLDIGPESGARLRRGARRRAGRSSGTARWASSRSPRSPTAPAPSPRR